LHAFGQVSRVTILSDQGVLLDQGGQVGGKLGQVAQARAGDQLGQDGQVIRLEKVDR